MSSSNRKKGSRPKLVTVKYTNIDNLSRSVTSDSLLLSLALKAHYRNLAMPQNII